MSALRGCGIDNVVIELDGAEVPVMDGSAMPFVKLIEEAGIAAQPAPRRGIKVLKEVTVEQDGKRATLKPSRGSIFGGEIEFDHPEIGRQEYKTQLVNGNFKHDIAECRTFGFLNEVQYLRQNGLALGGSLENAIVLDEDSVMNPEGLRHSDEFIRHKLLDAIGDLYLAAVRLSALMMVQRQGMRLITPSCTNCFQPKAHGRRLICMWTCRKSIPMPVFTRVQPKSRSALNSLIRVFSP